MGICIVGAAAPRCWAAVKAGENRMLREMLTWRKEYLLIASPKTLWRPLCFYHIRRENPPKSYSRLACPLCTKVYKPRAFPRNTWLCYNRKAVKAIWKREATLAAVRETAKVDPTGALSAAGEATAGGEHASTYCPVCSQRLESRRCKLVCNVCGYYMSCADYY